MCSVAGRQPHTVLPAPHLYGDVEHEAWLSRVSHAHHSDPIGIAHAHLLWEQREMVSIETPQGQWALHLWVKGMPEVGPSLALFPLFDPKGETNE